MLFLPMALVLNSTRVVTKTPGRYVLIKDYSNSNKLLVCGCVSIMSDVYISTKLCSTLKINYLETRSDAGLFDNR